MNREQEITHMREVMLPHVNTQLRQYQKEGVALMQERTRWLECDDMG